MNAGNAREARRAAGTEIGSLWADLPAALRELVDFDPYDAYGSVMGAWGDVCELAYLLGSCFEAFGPSPSMTQFRREHGNGAAAVASWYGDGNLSAGGAGEMLAEAYAAGAITMVDLEQADRVFEQAYAACKAAGLDY